MTTSVHVTWVPPHHLRFAARGGAAVDGLARLFPRLVAEVSPEGDVPVEVALPSLVEMPLDAAVSDSVRAFAYAARLGLELCARQHVVPAVEGGRARWRVILATPEDARRTNVIARALPAVACGPGVDGHATLRSFLDAVADAMYRRGAFPNPARGWVHELAHALRDDEQPFRTLHPSWRTVPDDLAMWTDEAEAGDVRLGWSLELPEGDGDRFAFRFRLHPRDGEAVDLASQWGQAGPLWSLIRGLARAVALHPPLQAAIDGPTPTPLSLDPGQTWALLQAVPRFRGAGVEVRLPDGFEPGGRLHLRARLRVGIPAVDADANAPCACRWEILLGDEVLPPEEVARLRGETRAVLRFRGRWIVLDPSDLARLPDVREAPVLPAREAVAAVLRGEYRGAGVVADDALDKLIDVLRDPPEVQAPAGLEATLRPYQGRGLAWLAAMGRLGLGACLADDMGLGKTVQLIAHLLHRRARPGKAARRPSLVVCPTSVLGNWQRELARFAPSLRVLRHHGTDRDVRVDFAQYDVVITTYGLVARDNAALSEVTWDVLALDEAQSIKNADSQRATSARVLRARHRIALSGTPVENRLEELWSLFEFLMPGMLGPRGAFRRDVALPIERFGDAGAAVRLRQTVGPFMLRRVKSDPAIAPDLPEKIEQKQICALTEEQASLYREVVDEEMAEIAQCDAQSRRARVLGMLTRLKQVCNHPAHALKEPHSALSGRSGKLERALELVDAIAQRGERTLVFTQYVEMGHLLARALEDAFGRAVPFLHGGCTAAQRDEMVRRFQTDESDEAPIAFVISLKAGGTGLNLTRARHVLHYDRWWNPAVEDQATDRAHRIGQTESVMVHKLLCGDTLEERIDQLLDEKRALATQIVGTGESLVATLDDASLRRLVALGSDAVVE